MKLRIAICLLLCALGLKTQLGAQTESQSLLWEISGNGISKPSYLYGTFHLLCEEDLARINPAMDALKNCNRLYLELDFDDPQMMAQMQEGMAMGDGSTIEKLLDAKKFKLLDSLFTQQTGVPLKLLSGSKPLLLASLLYQPMLGCAPSSPEQALAKAAAAQNKEVMGLETVAEQMAVFEKIPYRDQARMLYEYVTEPESFREETERMLKLYRMQDLEAMQAMMADPKYDLEKYRDILLDKRNRNWTEQMMRLMPETPTLFAVGAGHLGGDKGLISLLRAKGYIVRPVQ